MCVEEEHKKMIAKKAIVTTVGGRSLEGVTIMGPVRKMELGSGSAYLVRLYGKDIPHSPMSPWVVIQTAHDRKRRQILL